MAISKEQILAMASVNQLRQLNWQDAKERLISIEEFIHIYVVFESWWKHSGKPEDPHAELKSKNHSDGYINSRIPLSYANICEFLAYQMWLYFSTRHRDTKIDVIVSPSFGAMGIGMFLAKFFRAQYFYTEKATAGQTWNFNVSEDKVVLAIDELLTRGVSSGATIRAIRDGNFGKVNFYPEMLVLVNRSNTQSVEGLAVSAVFNVEMQDYAPSECVPCKNGSVALPPKKDGNWKHFQRQMKP
ncbi:MAG: hypothetical protein WCI57_00090 [Candidatus Berkelbacteria bacterium]